MKASDCILFSGGAPGAEAAFGACAERHGIEEVNFTFDGHNIDRHRGVRVLNHEELLAGDVSLEYVSRLMHRRYTESPTLRCVLQTLWYQVNSGQEIYVIGAIQDDDTVRGGTGWGAEFAKLCNKPLFVFDQDGESLVPLDGLGVGDAERREPPRHHASALHRHRDEDDSGQQPGGAPAAVRPLVHILTRFCQYLRLWRIEMRVTVLLLASVLFACAPAFAQEWELYTNNEDGFKLDFPGTPKITQTTFKSEYGAELPARVYTANKGQERYSLTVADYREAPRLLDEKAKATCQPGDERSCGLTLAGRGYWKEDMAGAVLWATYNFLQRNAKLTHLAYAWQDLVAGHEIQLLNPDQSRTFAFVAMHTDRLYILEGTVPKGYPPPVLFQQSMGYVDKNGNGMRYQTIYSNMYAEHPDVFPGQPKLTGQGRGGGPGAAPNAPPANGR